MRKLFFVVLLLGLFFGSCHNRSGDDYMWAGLYDDEETSEETIGEGNEGSAGGISVSPSFHGTKTVSSGCRTHLADIGEEVYPELIPIESDVVGGIKLCAEMSADRNGNYRSNTSENEPTTFYSYEQMGLILLNVPDCDGIPNILARVISGDITVDMGTICNNPDAFWGDGPSFQVPITITNNRPEDIDVDIPQGTMLEAENDNVQNIVVSETESLQLGPSQRKSIVVKAMCAARRRGDPIRSKVKLTPFRLNVPSWSYQTKQQLWDWIESNHQSTKEYTITFYSWGVGDPNGNGQPSQTGHAFVDIPGIGLVGYSGTVYDHSHLRQNATRSASVRVSQSDLENAQRKYYEWLNNPGEYEMARHDCTSFVMDIADAAHIWYGFRWSIQFPATFVRAVNFYNKWNN